MSPPIPRSQPSAHIPIVYRYSRALQSVLPQGRRTSDIQSSGNSDSCIGSIPSLCKNFISRLIRQWLRARNYPPRRMHDTPARGKRDELSVIAGNQVLEIQSCHSLQALTQRVWRSDRCCEGGALRLSEHLCGRICGEVTSELGTGLSPATHHKVPQISKNSIQIANSHYKL